MSEEFLDVITKRPGHMQDLKTVKREQWGDTAGVGGVISALGEVVLDEAISRIPGRGIAAALFKRSLRKGVNSYRYGNRRAGYQPRRYVRMPMRSRKQLMRFKFKGRKRNYYKRRRYY